jgi:hypothetical protein
MHALLPTPPSTGLQLQLQSTPSPPLPPLPHFLCRKPELPLRASCGTSCPVRPMLCLFTRYFASKRVNRYVFFALKIPYPLYSPPSPPASSCAGTFAHCNRVRRDVGLSTRYAPAMKTVKNCHTYSICSRCNSHSQRTFTPRQDRLLCECFAAHGPKWKTISLAFQQRGFNRQRRSLMVHWLQAGTVQLQRRVSCVT